MLKIREMEFNKKIRAFLLIKRIEARKTKNDNLYIDMTLSDIEGDEINGKIWDGEKVDLDIYKIGEVIKVEAIVQNYNNKKQLVIERFRLLEDRDNIDINDYIPSAPISSKEMLSEIYDYIEKINHGQMRSLVSTILSRRRDKLLYYPAAKSNHHDIKGGLLFHILTMLRLGEKLSELYDFINKDLLYTGIILHDMAKTEEMLSDKMGIVSDYTVEGKLLGHIVQGINEIDEVAREINMDNEVKVLVQHMILSHHYHPEYGSPVKPLIPEAELLHYLDIIDARMYAMNKVLSVAESGTFTDKSFALEGRSLYKFCLREEAVEGSK